MAEHAEQAIWQTSVATQHVAQAMAANEEEAAEKTVAEAASESQKLAQTVGPILQVAKSQWVAQAMAQ